MCCIWIRLEITKLFKNLWKIVTYLRFITMIKIRMEIFVSLVYTKLFKNGKLRNISLNKSIIYLIIRYLTFSRIKYTNKIYLKWIKVFSGCNIRSFFRIMDIIKITNFYKFINGYKLFKICCYNKNLYVPFCLFHASKDI